MYNKIEQLADLLGFPIEDIAEWSDDQVSLELFNLYETNP